MAEKKEEKAKKTTPKVVKRAQPAKPKESKKIEQQFFAKDLADQMGVTPYDFLLIKRENEIKDDTPLTASEMKELYNKIQRR